MKGILIRFGIGNFNVKLKKASQRLETLRGPEGELPPNPLAELRREMERLTFIKEQTKEIEKARLAADSPLTGTNQ